MQDFIRVMLVDDEYLAIEDLKTLIDWQSLGFTITATARSGRQALMLFETEPVDLVITDISMPNMDGIVLISQLKKKHPGLLFLLLTAYAEIDYMKSALQLGVEDYLMKDEMNSALLCEKLSAIRDKYLDSCRLSYSYLQKILHSYFCDIHAPFPTGAAFLPKYNLFYCILIPDLIFPWIEEVLLLKNVSATRMLNDALIFMETYESIEPKNLCSFIAYNNKIVTVLHMDHITSAASHLQLLSQYAHTLIADLQKQLGLSFSCFYSHLPMSLDKLHDDYFLRQKAVRARYFLGSNLVESLDSPNLFVTNETLDLTEDTLKQLLKAPDKNLAAFITEAFDSVMENHNYIGLSHLLNTCFSFLLKTSDCISSKIEEVELTDVSVIRTFILESAIELEEKSHPTHSRETQKAIQYILSHYHEEQLTIQDIAKEIGLSTTHFSRIFKMDTGETVWDYLTTYRIQKACSILRNSDAKIYEIAEMTGYSSPQYFSQVFYKQMGMKPLDYRKGTGCT